MIADSRLLYVPIPESDQVELAEDYVFWVDGLEVWIPAGFRWNGASIPRFLWSVIGGRFEPATLRASLEHDWIYLCHGVARRQADKQFRRRLQEAGMSAWKAASMYQAVRIFGRSHWPTTNEDQERIRAIRLMLSIRPDQDRFTRMMLAA